MKTEQVRGFYKGLPAGIIGVMLYKGTAFLCIEHFIARLESNTVLQSSWSRHALSSAIAATFAQLLSYPFDVIKRRSMVLGPSDRMSVY